jgi:hypothetical protein
MSDSNRIHTITTPIGTIKLSFDERTTEDTKHKTYYRVMHAFSDIKCSHDEPVEKPQKNDDAHDMKKVVEAFNKLAQFRFFANLAGFDENDPDVLEGYEEFIGSVNKPISKGLQLRQHLIENLLKHYVRKATERRQMKETSDGKILFINPLTPVATSSDNQDVSQEKEKSNAPHDDDEWKKELEHEDREIARLREFKDTITHMHPQTSAAGEKTLDELKTELARLNRKIDYLTEMKKGFELIHDDIYCTVQKALKEEQHQNELKRKEQQEKEQQQQAETPVETDKSIEELRKELDDVRAEIAIEEEKKKYRTSIETNRRYLAQLKN